MVILIDSMLDMIYFLSLLVLPFLPSLSAGMFRGGSTNIVRSLPGAALQFAVYDAFKKVLGIAVD